MLSLCTVFSFSQAICFVSILLLFFFHSHLQSLRPLIISVSFLPKNMCWVVWCCRINETHTCSVPANDCDSRASFREPKSSPRHGKVASSGRAIGWKGWKQPQVFKIEIRGSEHGGRLRCGIPQFRTYSC